MKQCIRCGSFAINPTMHGRTPSESLDLCDVCYWRKRAEDGRKLVVKVIDGHVQVNLEDLKECREFIDAVNEFSVEDIEWMRAGVMQKVEQRLYEEWKYIGLSPASFADFAGLLDDEDWGDDDATEAG